LAPQRERLRKSIVNVEPPYAADRILDELERIDMPPVRPAQVGVGSGFVAKVIQAGRRWLPQKAAAKRDERSLQKFPGVAAEEISGPLAQWADASILTQVPQITRLHDRLWALH
jgi:hypothetical protein